MRNKLIHHLKYPKDIDLGMVGLLDVLNSIPGCRTTFSCEGHGKEPFYVVCCFCGRVGGDVEKLVCDAFRDVHGEFEFSQNPSDVSKFRGCLGYEHEVGIYNSHIGFVVSDEVRRAYISRMAERLAALVPENEWSRTNSTTQRLKTVESESD